MSQPPADDFSWHQPESFDEAAPAEELVESMPSYANPPSEEIVKYGADYQVMRDELRAQIAGPRKQAQISIAVLLCSLLVFVLPHSWLPVIGWFIPLAGLLVLGAPFFVVLGLMDWQRMGRYPSPTFRRPLINANRLAAFGRAYTALGLEETTELVLAAAEDLGIELHQTGPTTWEGNRRGDYTYDPSRHKIDIRPSADRPGMTLITSLTEAKDQGLVQNSAANWQLNYELLHSPEDAKRVDPRKPQQPELPRDTFDSRTGKSDRG